MNSSSVYAQTPAHDVTRSYIRNAASSIRTKTQSNDSYTWGDFVAIDHSNVSNGLDQYTLVQSNGVSGKTYCYGANADRTPAV